MAGPGEPRVASRLPPHGHMDVAVLPQPVGQVGERHGRRRVRADVGDRQRALPGDHAVDEHLPAGPQVAQPDERAPVLDAQAAPSPGDGDGPIHPGHLAHRRVRLQVGGHQAVGDEVAVVGCVAELAAVGEAHPAVGQPLAQAVVLPLPQEAALQAGGGGDRVPIVGERAVAVAHRVAVLAHDQRPRADARLPVLADGVDRGVHGTHHICRRQAAVVPPLGPHGALVVQRPRRVATPDPPRERSMVRAVAAFVAQAPQDHRRVVPVALHHPGTPVDPRRPVSRIVTEAAEVRVALDVGLVHQIEAEFVAEVIEGVVVGIVRRADRADVVGPHQREVGPHIVEVDRLAPVGVVVVAVHSEDPDRLAVHQQLPVAHLDAPDADVLGLNVGHESARVDQLRGHRVPPGGLGAPCLGAGDIPVRGYFEAREPVWPGVLLRNRLTDRGTDLLAAGVPQCGPHRPARRRSPAEVDHGSGIDRPDRGERIERGGDGQVGEVDIGARLDPDGAVQARHPPLILVLDVAVGAVPHDHDRQLVAIGHQERPHVVFAGKAAVGAVPDEPAVHVDGMHALGPRDVQHGPALHPAGRHREGAAINPGRVPLRQPGRRTIERHLDVGVVGRVHERFTGRAVEVLNGPVAGHGDGRGPRPLALQCASRHRVGAVEQLQRPATVKRAAVEPSHRDVHRQPIEL